ncbi:hypothetical protein RKD29_005581 [Streptomyces tendae]
MRGAVSRFVVCPGEHGVRAARVGVLRGRRGRPGGGAGQSGCPIRPGGGTRVSGLQDHAPRTRPSPASPGGGAYAEGRSGPACLVPCGRRTDHTSPADRPTDPPTRCDGPRNRPREPAGDGPLGRVGTAAPHPAQRPTGADGVLRPRTRERGATAQAPGTPARHPGHGTARRHSPTPTGTALRTTARGPRHRRVTARCDLTRADARSDPARGTRHRQDASRTAPNDNTPPRRPAPPSAQPPEAYAPKSVRSRWRGSKTAGVAAMVRAPVGRSPGRPPVTAPASRAIRSPAARSQGCSPRS